MKNTGSRHEAEDRHEEADLEHGETKNKPDEGHGLKFIDSSESSSVEPESIGFEPLESEPLESEPPESEPPEPKPLESEPFESKLVEPESAESNSAPFSFLTSANLPEFSGKKYRIYGFLILLFALILRLFNLGERVLHHDESVHASFTLKLLNNGQYSYNPAYHGPFLYHVTALVFQFFGINDATARLLPALFGGAAILILFLLKKELGKKGVLWSAYLLAFSPCMVYFSRFFRNDMIIVFCTIAVVAGGVRYIENLHNLKRYPYLILSVSALAIAVTAKENAYLIIFIFGAYAGLSICYKIYSNWRLDKRVQQNAEKQIEPETEKEFGQQVEKELGTKAEKEFRQELETEAEKETGQELEVEAKKEFRQELETEAEKETGQKLEAEAEKETEQEIGTEAGKEPQSQNLTYEEKTLDIEVEQEAKKENYNILNSQKKPRKSSLSFKSFLPFIPDIILSVALFLFIVMLFYTSYFRNPVSVSSIVERAFSHWMAMHRIERLGGPFYYYLPLLLVYEIPILLFGILGFLDSFRKKGKNAWFFHFLCYWALTSLLLYSYLQEKVPWLVVHIVLPLGILAGAYIGENFSWKESLSCKKNKIITGILVLSLLVSLVQCISVNYYKSMDPAERITYTQASPEIREFMEKIDGLTLGPDRLRVCVYDPNNLYWPLPWYLRDYKKASYFSKLPQNKRYDAIIVPSQYNLYEELSEDKYASYNFTLRPGKEYTLYYKISLEK